MKKSDTPKRHRFDGLLVVAVTGAISLLIAIAVPVGCALSLMGRYHRFVQDLGESLLYAREHGTLEIAIDGETQPGQMEQAERLYRLISDMGMGSPLGETPDEGALALSFGDGSVLRLFPTTINESDGTKVDGTIVSYTRSDGHVFSYDTDLFAYRNVVSDIMGSAG